MILVLYISWKSIAMGCRFTFYSLFTDIQNSILDIHNSFLDIHNWIMDILK